MTVAASLTTPMSSIRGRSAKIPRGAEKLGEWSFRKIEAPTLGNQRRRVVHGRAARADDRCRTPAMRWKDSLDRLFVKVRTTEPANVEKTVANWCKSKHCRIWRSVRFSLRVAALPPRNVHHQRQQPLGQFDSRAREVRFSWRLIKAGYAHRLRGLPRTLCTTASHEPLPGVLEKSNACRTETAQGRARPERSPVSRAF